MFNPFSLFRPKHTFQKLAQELAEGLENGTITLGDDADDTEETSDSPVTTTQPVEPKPGG